MVAGICIEQYFEKIQPAQLLERLQVTNQYRKPYATICLYELPLALLATGTKESYNIVCEPRGLLSACYFSSFLLHANSLPNLNKLHMPETVPTPMRIRDYNVCHWSRNLEFGDWFQRLSECSSNKEIPHDWRLAKLSTSEQLNEGLSGLRASCTL